ncbi:hypothetical protein [Limobrevibacterium gyesilva]|uniref:Hydrophobic W protein n=1 Tax=Limobrevibacterium gyesilva TaxID=2991712 RepID=A0AA41YQ28_9PROT|nr:hypothetical protein [Limobrevibacterium gyesilva]MCW3477594.1 hypothetical protein [Limobrevibacterium gyesilva]
MPEAASERPNKLVNELRVSGHLMTLEAGLFCIVQSPSKVINAAAGLPGVRVSLPPGPMGRPEAVSIATFRDDGWLSGFGDAALVRVVGGPAQILVTVYQAPDVQDGAPNLQVLRLADGAAAAGAVAGAPGAGAAAAAQPQHQAQPAASRSVDVVAHIQSRGDVPGELGEWLGEPGSKRWIEGFGIAPSNGIAAGDIEYQAVLGRGWLSPWVEGGQFCGSRGMSLPVLGLKLRLRGAAAEAFECSYSATFVDGTEVGPVKAGEACEAESLAPLEAFRIDIRPRGQVAEVAAPAVPRTATKPAATKPAAAKPVGAKAKPAAKKPASEKTGAKAPRRRS